jgi:ribonuclease-3
MQPIPHAFQDESLRELALTHSSTGAPRDNERLEFLGDAVLDLVTAEHLYADPDDLPEGPMTEFKASVVSRRTLAEAATRLELEEIAHIGPGLRRSAFPRSVLANLYEAVLGAVYLDAGLEAARAFVHTTLGEELARTREMEGADNPKQELQELSQKRWGAPPSYRALERHGRAHARAFLVAAEVGGRRFPAAWGRNLKEAERWAAFEALLILEPEAQA